jgi:pyroglutamyl-peptidase
VLLTGFQSYGGRSINPAEEIVRALDGAVIGGETVQGRTLPVNYAELGPRIAGLIEETAPRAVICLGLWPGEPMIRLERIAVNIADFEIPDNVGSMAQEPVVEGGPTGLASTLPLAAIRAALLAAGIPARLSGTAGQFLCTALMYQALTYCAARAGMPACGFIHVPYVPEQVAGILRDVSDEARLELHQRADLSSMALEQMVEAIRIAIRTTMEACAR